MSLNSLDDALYTSTSEVRFRDTDAMGIVNHAVIVSYLENTRSDYLFDVLDIEGVEEINFLIARVECDLRSPVRYGDTVRCGIIIPSIGNKSFKMAYRLEQEATGELVAEGRTVQVFYDYERGTSIAVPQDFRRAITE